MSDRSEDFAEGKEKNAPVKQGVLREAKQEVPAADCNDIDYR